MDTASIVGTIITALIGTGVGYWLGTRKGRPVLGLVLFLIGWIIMLIVPQDGLDARIRTSPAASGRSRSLRPRSQATGRLWRTIPNAPTVRTRRAYARVNSARCMPR